MRRTVSRSAGGRSIGRTVPPPQRGEEDARVAQEFIHGRHGLLRPFHVAGVRRHVRHVTIPHEGGRVADEAGAGSLLDVSPDRRRAPHVVAEALRGRKAAFQPEAIPAVAFSDPEIATAGMTLAEAKAAGADARAVFPLSASGRPRVPAALTASAFLRRASVGPPTCESNAEIALDAPLRPLHS